MRRHVHLGDECLGPITANKGTIEAMRLKGFAIFQDPRRVLGDLATRALKGGGENAVEEAAKYLEEKRMVEAGVRSEGYKCPLQGLDPADYGA